MKRILSPYIIVVFCLAAAASVQSQPARGGLSLIAVPTESEAVALHSRIRSGESFEAIAMAYSTDASAPRSGYLGVVDESRLSRELRDALKGVTAGAISAVTRAGERFVLLKRTTAEEDRWRLQQDSAADALQRGRYAEAAALFLAAAEQAEKFGGGDVRLAESLNGMAQVYRYQQNYAAAEPGARRSLAILETALGPLQKALIPSLANLAVITASTERYEEAERAYRRILALRWGGPGGGGGADRVLENFAEVLSLDLTRDPGFKRAVEEYRRSISDSVLDKDVYVVMRDGFVAAKLMEEAEFLMNRAVEAYPDSLQLQFQFGELYAMWGKYQKAIDEFETAGRRDTSANPDVARQQRGLIYERIGEMNFYLVRFDEAIAALTKALETNPASWSPRLLLGKVYLRRNKLEDAIAEYSRVIAANSQVAVAHEGIAQARLDLGRYPEAVKEAERALAIDPGLQRPRYIKAMALIRSGNEREGRPVLEEYQQRESEQGTAASHRSALAELEEKALEAQPQEAKTLLSDGVSKYPLEPRLYLKLGLVQSRLGLHRESAETFETMIRKQMDDFLVHRQLAREYDELGNGDDSRKERVLYLQRYDAALQMKAN